MFFILEGFQKGAKIIFFGFVFLSVAVQGKISYYLSIFLKIED